MFILWDICVEYGASQTIIKLQTKAYDMSIARDLDIFRAISVPI